MNSNSNEYFDYEKMEYECMMLKRNKLSTIY